MLAVHRLACLGTWPLPELGALRQAGVIDDEYRVLNTAPASARVPVSPSAAFIFPSQARLRGVSGTFSDRQPSKAPSGTGRTALPAWTAGPAVRPTAEPMADLTGNAGPRRRAVLVDYPSYRTSVAIPAPTRRNQYLTPAQPS